MNKYGIVVLGMSLVSVPAFAAQHVCQSQEKVVMVAETVNGSSFLFERYARKARMQAREKATQKCQELGGQMVGLETSPQADDTNRTTASGLCVVGAKSLDTESTDTLSKE